MKLSNLKENPDNPRIIKDDKFKKLCQSLKEFPQMMELRPIIIDDDNVIQGGNMRFKALSELGYTDVPDEWIKRGKSLTPEQWREFVIKDNVGFGEWDWELIKNDWDVEQLTDWGLDVPNFEPEILEAEEDDFDVPEGGSKTDIVLGDLFEIGEHRLLCGDSTDSEQVDKLMNGEKADMVFTDPPYGVSYADKNKYLNTISRGNSIQVNIENDHMNLDDTKAFILLSFKNIKRILAKRSSYYITATQGGDLMMMMMMMEAGIPLRHCLIWAKNNHVLGRTDYNYKHEPILYGWDEVHDFYGKGEFRFSVWDIDKPLKNDLHPTMKPIKLMTNALLNSTLEGMICADIFLGSGSTMVASHQLNRKCYGIELDPKYCQVIVDRMRKLDPSLIIKKNGILI